jgi:hypothetical protein
MCFEIQNRWSSEYRITELLCLILCILLLFVAGACSRNRQVIENETLDDWDGRRMRYKNLFPPSYGLGELTEYDHIDFLQAHERKPHKDSLKKWNGLS